jgi:HlyD family secretion protein
MKPDKKQVTEEAIAFLPDAIEIKNEKLPLWARYSVIFSLIFFACAILWASLGKVDVVVKAGGELTSDKQNIVMKPRESSMIKEIKVRIGDVVEKDQVLVTFDPTLSEADVERIAREVAVLSAKYERFMAEFTGKEYRPQVLNSNTREQLAIFKQRRDYYNSKIRYYDEALKQLAASKKSKEDSYKNQVNRLETVRKLEKMYEDLRSKQATTLKELWNIQITRIEMEGNLDTLRNSLVELAHQKESIISSKESFIHEWHNSISENLVATGRELDGNRKQYEQAKTMLSFVELRSPCRAIVHEIAPFPEGSAVGEAEALITLVPIDGNIEVEARVEPRDIGRIAPGSDVRIKLSAWSFQKHGTINGKVLHISEDTISRGGAAGGIDPATGEPRSMTYYRARISIEGTDTLRNLPKNFRLVPGMEVEAEIKTGRRRIIEYITYPLIKALDETAREP